MSVHLRYEQCCAEDGCQRPARYGDLCTRCYMAASPAVRAVCHLLDAYEAVHPNPLPATPCPELKAGVDAHREASEIRALEELWDAPAADERWAA